MGGEYIPESALQPKVAAPSILTKPAGRELPRPPKHIHSQLHGQSPTPPRMPAAASPTSRLGVRVIPESAFGSKAARGDVDLTEPEGPEMKDESLAPPHWAVDG